MGGSVLSDIRGVQNTINQIPVLNRFSLVPRNNAPPEIRKFMSDNKGIPIKKLLLGRKPIVKNIDKLFNVLTLGKWNKKKKDLGYDDVLHNYLLLELDNGKVVKLEKNHVVEVDKAREGDFGNKLYNIPVNKNIDVGELISTASRGDKDFWIYDPKNSNWQNFTKEIIQRNNLTPVDKETREAIDPQDGAKLIETLGPLSSLPKEVTDLAGGIDRAVFGNGIKPEFTVDQLFELVNA